MKILHKLKNLTVSALTVKLQAKFAEKLPHMLTDLGLKKLKSRDKSYKVSDRDGMYAAVSSTGTITFRYDYRLNGRRETLTIGVYGSDGLSLSEAREKCVEARKAVSEGKSPALEKQREKRRQAIAKDFGEAGKQWFVEARMADSTRSMRKAIFDRDILPVWKKQAPRRNHAR